MWSVGRYDLRLSEDEFWGLTLREFSLLVDRWFAEQESADFRTAQIACILANVNRDEKKQSQPFEVKDFMLHYREPKAPTGLTKPVMSDEAMERYARAMTIALGGRIVKKTDSSLRSE